MSQRAISESAADRPVHNLPSGSPRVVFLTAGAAGMYCGSCMHDNALAKAMREQGLDCILQPIYTPIRTEHASVAQPHVFFGGIHIYVLQQWPWLRFVPTVIRRSLDWTPLLRLATRRAHTSNADALGELTLSMLQGLHGRQCDEVQRLVDWLIHEIQPDAIVLSNLLIGGCLPAIREHMAGMNLIVFLQGDDIFLDYLSPAHREEAIDLCRRLADSVDQFVTNSHFYADKMGALLHIPNAKRVIMPLSIDTAPFDTATGDVPRDDTFRLGYLARIAPEKGFHLIVDAFIKLANQPGHEDLTLHAAGWLGPANEQYMRDQTDKIEKAGLQARFTYHGSPSLEEKVQFLRSLDLMSVPTEYEEPKGLFVLEALAAGVPVVQPRHGAFVELVEATGGGILVAPKDPDALADGIAELKGDPDRRRELAEQGRQQLHAHHTIEQAAERMIKLLT